MKKDSAISNESLYFKLPVYLGDLTIHLVLLWVIIKWIVSLPQAGLGAFMGTQGPFLLMAVAYTASIYGCKIKLATRIFSYYRVVSRAIVQCFWTSVIYLVMASLTWYFVPWLLCLIELGAAAVLVSIWHVLMRVVIMAARKNGRNTRFVLMVGADENLVYIHDKMMAGYGIHGYKIQGFFTDKYQGQIPDGVPCLGPVDQALDYLKSHHVDEVYCAVNPAANQELVNALIHQCESDFIQFWFVPNMNGYPKRRMNHSEFGSVTVISLREEPLNNPVMKFWKRTVDIIFSGLFLITLYPFVWAFAAIGIKISSPGPILFRQKRTGYNGRAFDCLKFRSMKVNAAADTLQATEDDPRKTKFGDFLRKTSIDELPQFINVFKGDMSVVGPRPHMEHHTDIYSQLISDYMVRHLLKPGITGWAQVNGCRGETKTLQEMKDRVEHDIWYIEHWSPALDIKIIFMTIRQILGGDKQAY